MRQSGRVSYRYTGSDEGQKREREIGSPTKNALTEWV
jgi:hypothetical protein